jgi:hypothetical protein
MTMISTKTVFNNDNQCPPVETRGAFGASAPRGRAICSGPGGRDGRCELRWGEKNGAWN